MKLVALLRGINVGKSVRVPMNELKILLAKLGAADVITYLNSGNLVFESDGETLGLSQSIERELKKAFGPQVPVAICYSQEISAIAKSIPKTWQGDETQQTYVVYLPDDVASPRLVSELPVKHEYVTFRYAHKAIIWNIKKENFNRSQITKIATHKAYGRMTIRNVNTARKLAELSGNR